MGIPGLIIAEKMVPCLQEMLISAGIKVEKETYSEEQKTLKRLSKPNKNQAYLNVPAFCLHCENKEGERVKLTFGRLSLEPFDLVIAVLPLPHSLWKTFIKRERNKLVDQIIIVLKENGAKDFKQI